VPRGTRLACSSVARATSKPAPPDDVHTQVSDAPARVLVTVMRSATMKAE
jgi:hypothetical protein